MDNKKLLFLAFVVENITENPDWLPDLTQALNRGLSEALSNEREKAADLAYSLSWLVSNYPMQAKKNLNVIIRGVLRLVEFFKGAPIETEFKELAMLWKDKEE